MSEQMKFEAGKTYKTRGGSDVLILAVHASLVMPIVGVHDGSVETWAHNGGYHGVHSDSSLDLIAEKVDGMERVYRVLGNLANILETDASHVNSQTALNRNEVLAEAKAILAERNR